jgi:uncharacterized protein YggE
MKAILATLLTLVCAGLASANVTVTGTGKVSYVPDLAYLGVGVSSEGKTAAEAWTKNRAAVQKLFDALKALGIDPADFKTGSTNLTPRYVYHSGQDPQLVGYTASYELSVTVRKLDGLGTVMDRLVEAGANQRMSVSFATSDEEKLLDEARIKAVTDARKKAQLYTTAAGANLGPVVSIAEGEGAPRPIYTMERTAADKGAGLPIAPGRQELTVRVTVVFGIVQPGSTARP